MGTVLQHSIPNILPVVIFDSFNTNIENAQFSRS